MRHFLLLCFLFSCSPLILAQKLLQVEKFGSPKTIKYYIGQELKFTLSDDPSYWYEDVINDIHVAEGLIVFGNRAVRLSDITAVKSANKRLWLRGLGNSLYIFGIGWGFFSLADLLVGGELGWAAAIVPATSFALGWIIKRIARPKTYKIGKKRKLRLLNLTPMRGAP